MCLISRLVVVSREAKKKQHACTSSGPRDHYSELFTRMAVLKLEKAVTQPLQQFRLLNYKPSKFQLSKSTTQRWNISAQLFWKTSQPEIFDDGFRDYSQNSTNTHIVS